MEREHTRLNKEIGGVDLTACKLSEASSIKSRLTYVNHNEVLVASEVPFVVVPTCALRNLRLCRDKTTTLRVPARRPPNHRKSVLRSH